jgi:hypothetical protein
MTQVILSHGYPEESTENQSDEAIDFAGAHLFLSSTF